MTCAFLAKFQPSPPHSRVPSAEARLTFPYHSLHRIRRIDIYYHRNVRRVEKRGEKRDDKWSIAAKTSGDSFADLLDSVVLNRGEQDLTFTAAVAIRSMLRCLFAMFCVSFSATAYFGV